MNMMLTADEWQQIKDKNQERIFTIDALMKEVNIRDKEILQLKEQLKDLNKTLKKMDKQKIQDDASISLVLENLNESLTIIERHGLDTPIRISESELLDILA